MTITLHLGVMDISYTVNAPRRVVSRTKNGVTKTHTAPANGAQTTGDVAEYLENKYHVMEIFFEENQQQIANAIAGAMQDSLERLIITGQAGKIFPAEGLPEVQDAFNRFIDTKQMDGIQPGVPTAASLKGVNHRLKIKKGPVRPSFKDTGLYEQTMRAWVDVK